MYKEKSSMRKITHAASFLYLIDYLFKLIAFLAALTASSEVNP